MSKTWKEMIVTMALVKQELMKNDMEKILPYHLPTLAALKEDVANTERALGFKLDDEYKGFLENSNGWRCFYQTVDLFGTKQIQASPDMEYAMMILDSIDDNVWTAIGFVKNEVLPIAATRYDKDIFVLTKPKTKKPGIVIWLAGEEIDRYPSFSEFFLAMIDYNRAMVDDLKKG